MEVTTTRRDYRCDQCQKFGMIKIDERSHVPIEDGTWFELRIQGYGVAKDLCSISCIAETLNQMKVTKQTKITIKKSLVRDA